MSQVKAEFLVHISPSSTYAETHRPIAESVLKCYLSGIGVEGMSEYEVKGVKVERHEGASHLLAVSVELERIGGQFVSKKEIAEVLGEAVCGVEQVLGVELPIT